MSEAKWRIFYRAELRARYNASSEAMTAIVSTRDQVEEGLQRTPAFQTPKTVAQAIAQAGGDARVRFRKEGESWFLRHSYDFPADSPKDAERMARGMYAEAFKRAGIPPPGPEEVVVTVLGPRAPRDA